MNDSVCYFRTDLYTVTFATIKGRLVNKKQNNPSPNFSQWKYKTALFDLDFVSSLFFVV